MRLLQSTPNDHRRRVLAAVVALAGGAWGCGAWEDGGRSGSRRLVERDRAPDAAVPGEDAPDAEQSPDASGRRPSGGGDPKLFVLVNDLTEGIGIGAHFGTDVDAVTWSCPDGERGAAVSATGRRREPASAVPLDAALGEPDGPCDPISRCAAPLGAQGWAAFGIERDSLRGCEVTVHEHADSPKDRFEVFICPTPAFENDCGAPRFSGRDGEAATGAL